MSVGVIRKKILVICGVQVKSDTPLSEAVGALNLHRFVFGSAQRRQEHCCQNCNNGDDDKQLDKREGYALICSRAHGVRKRRDRASFMVAVHVIEIQESPCVQLIFGSSREFRISAALCAV